MSRRPQSGAAPKESFIARMCDEAATKVPPQYAGYVRSVKPVVVGVADFIDAAWPYVMRLYDLCVQLWIMLEPYNPQQFFPVIAGLAMVFFGGSYLTIIAAAEAVRLSVWERLSTSVRVLHKNYLLAKEANAKDNSVDADGNGVADVDEISNKELFTRKVYLVAKSIDPQQTSDAVSALWAGFLTIIATIKIKFAQYITLGCAMGDMVRQTLGPKIEPLVNDALPVELKKWAPTIVRQIFATLGVFLALFLQQIVGGFHASCRGAQLATGNLIVLAKKYGYLAPDFDEGSQSAAAAAMVLAAFGFIWQLRNGFAVPFPLNILFLPATLVEGFLSLSVTIGL